MPNLRSQKRKRGGGLGKLGQTPPFAPYARSLLSTKSSPNYHRHKKAPWLQIKKTAAPRDACVAFSIPGAAHKKNKTDTTRQTPCLCVHPGSPTYPFRLTDPQVAALRTIMPPGLGAPYAPGPGTAVSLPKKRCVPPPKPWRSVAPGSKHVSNLDGIDATRAAASATGDARPPLPLGEE